jgi:hypothetical protein
MLRQKIPRSVVTRDDRDVRGIVQLYDCNSGASRDSGKFRRRQAGLPPGQRVTRPFWGRGPGRGKKAGAGITRPAAGDASTARTASRSAAVSPADPAWGRQGHGDGNAGLQETQLLELFAVGQGGRRQAGVPLEKGPAIGVKPHVPEMPGPAGADRGCPPG